MQGIDIVDVDRGGLLTYHGPGQLVGYPIMRVADLMGYVRTMEQAIVTALVDEGVPGAARALRRRARLHRRLDRRAQDRLDRRAPLARGHDARLRGQRRQRPAALRVGRALRPARRAHDLGHARARHRRPPAVLSQAHGLPLRRGLRPPPAARVGGAPGGGGRRRAGARHDVHRARRRGCRPRPGVLRGPLRLALRARALGQRLHDPHARGTRRDPRRRRRGVALRLLRGRRHRRGDGARARARGRRSRTWTSRATRSPRRSTGASSSAATTRARPSACTSRRPADGGRTTPAGRRAAGSPAAARPARRPRR